MEVDPTTGSNPDPLEATVTQQPRAHILARRVAITGGLLHVAVAIVNRLIQLRSSWAAYTLQAARLLHPGHAAFQRQYGASCAQHPAKPRHARSYSLGMPRLTRHDF